jgi:hypothetical protein
LNYVLGHEHFAENGRLMVHALSVMDDEAAWHAYWHWVYLAADKRGEDVADECEYAAVTEYLQGTIQDTGGSKPTAWECEYQFWYTKAREAGMYNVTRREQFMLIDVKSHLLWVANKWFGRHPSTSVGEPLTGAAYYKYLDSR